MLRKFLKLLGIKRLSPAQSALVDVTFALQQATTRGFLPIPAGTQLYAADPLIGEDIVFTTRENINVVEAELDCILSYPASGTFVDNTHANNNKNLYFHAFGSKDTRPEGGDELYFGFTKTLATIQVMLTVFLKDSLASLPDEEETSSLFSSVSLVWEYYSGEHDEDFNKADNWSRVDDDDSDDTTFYFIKSGKIKITVPNDMGQTTINGKGPYYWLRCKVENEGYDTPPVINSIQLNTVSAIQSTPGIKETFSCNGLPDFSINLKVPPVPDKTIIIEVNDEKWQEVEDFDAAKPGDNCYTVNLLTGRITFGNGIHGRIPPKGDNTIVVSYCSGGGIRGNVKPGQINRVEGALAHSITVTNTSAASVGTDAETLEQGIYRARADLNKITRAVTSADYEYLALHTPHIKVARAKALEGYHPDQKNRVPGIVTVIVVPETTVSNPQPTPEFLKTVYFHLDKYRLCTTELFVMKPEYKKVTVSAYVVVKPVNVQARVEERVREKLKRFLHPITGWTDGNGWPFGRPVYVSEIYEVIDSVDGVDYVTGVKLNESVSDIIIPAHWLIISGEHEIPPQEE